MMVAVEQEPDIKERLCAGRALALRCVDDTSSSIAQRDGGQPEEVARIPVWPENSPVRGGAAEAP